MVQAEGQSTAKALPARTDWYVSAMERLVGVVQNLSHARDLETVMSIVRSAARELTGADGATFVLRDGDKCYYAEENAISPLWKGQRFPMETCISGWVMLNARPAVIEDIYQDPRIPAAAYRPTFVKSLVMMPIRAENPVGAIGNYWARNRMPSGEELAILQALAGVTAVAMENVDLYTRLEEKVRALEASNHELNCFAWAASHDLKSPLRGIDNLSAWISEELEAGDRDAALRHVPSLRRRVRRMEVLLNDILEYARVEHDATRAEMTGGVELKQDVLDMVDPSRGFTVKFTGDFDRVNVPRTALLRILCNLVGNAIKHHDRTEGKIEVHVAEEEARYVFTVRDDGPGIPPEYGEKVFQMFQTLQPRDSREASGMGLTLARKILTLHGSDITLEPGTGRGAVFRFGWPKRLEIAGGA